MYDCVVFDFDGLILDTETPQMVAWQLTYQHFGSLSLDLEAWTASLGRNANDPARFDPLEELRTEIGRHVPDSEIHQVLRAYRDDLLDKKPVLPGVLRLLDEADALDIPVAIASSAPISWIERHLLPRGLIERFPVLSCAGNGVPGKPDPAVYRTACEALRADPSRSLALEDSPVGTTAAKAAGLTCFAVPSGVSRQLAFGHADGVFASLEQISLADASS